MDYKDYFSGHSRIYASARPNYPDSLFSYISSLCSQRELAWDCACGNGQASLALTHYFDRVIASDASEDQLAQAQLHEKIHYQQATAEEKFLSAATVDLITVAQALHWFNLEKFYNNARFVLKPRGVLAVWGYGLHRINSGIDEVIDYLYEDILGPYWPEERRLIEAAYTDINFPFDEIDSPEIEMSKIWSFDELLKYLESWSAVQRYIKSEGINPLDLLVDKLRSSWGNASKRKIIWPLILRIGMNR